MPVSGHQFIGIWAERLTGAEARGAVVPTSVVLVFRNAVTLQKLTRQVSLQTASSSPPTFAA